MTDGVRTGRVALVAGAVVVVIIALVGVAWQLVLPPEPAAHQPSAASPLEHELFTPRDDTTAARMRLDSYRWVDRDARVVRIPIDRAIDAVVADPTLLDLGGHVAEVAR